MGLTCRKLILLPLSTHSYYSSFFANSWLYFMVTHLFNPLVVEYLSDEQEEDNGGEDEPFPRKKK